MGLKKSYSSPSHNKDSKLNTNYPLYNRLLYARLGLVKDLAWCFSAVDYLITSQSCRST